METPPNPAIESLKNFTGLSEAGLFYVVIGVLAVLVSIFLYALYDGFTADGKTKRNLAVTGMLALVAIAMIPVYLLAKWFTDTINPFIGLPLFIALTWLLIRWMEKRGIR